MSESGPQDRARGVSAARAVRSDETHDHRGESAELEGALDRMAEGGGKGGADISQREVDQLTEFFLGTGRKRPGEGSTKRIGVNLSPDEHATEKDEWEARVRSISWEEWDTAQQLGLTKDSNGVEVPDGFRQAALVCAYAIVEPDLAAVRAALPAGPNGERPDIAALLRDFFRWQPGGLIQIQNVVLRMSRLSLASNSVREIDAAKT